MRGAGRGGAMKRKRDEKERFCSSGDRIPLFDLKKATVTRLPAVGKVAREEEDTTQSKLDSLDYDLKIAIVTRLPAKSLMKFRCVSKMWASFIRSQELVDAYYAMSSATGTRFIVAFSNGIFGKPKEKLTFFLSFPEGSSSSSLVPRFEMALPVVLRASQEYCASLHGFLGVYIDSGLMVCNPSTEQVFNLPKNTQYMGYDPIGGQHKALSVRLRDPSSGPHLLHKVLTLGGCHGWRDIEGTPVPYKPLSAGVCINGVVYYGGFDIMENPVVVCFDVRSENLSFIQAPIHVVFRGSRAIFIEYNGKLASIFVNQSYARSIPFDLWILEDAEKHEWSKQTCVFPSAAWESVSCRRMSFHGTNKAGEIIISTSVVSSIKVQPFYIFYYNVRTNTVRRVRLLGIGDNEEFQRSYGFLGKFECLARVAPQHVDSIAFLNNHHVT